ncbi:Hypothetical predicted protein, partial [Paramuricea clavata]
MKRRKRNRRNIPTRSEKQVQEIFKSKINNHQNKRHADIVLKDKNDTQHRRNSSHVKLYQEIPDAEEEIQSDRKHDRQTEIREENTEATQTETNQSTTEAEIVLRRSTRRNRKQPDYLKEFEAYKTHTEKLLLKERELNSKLRQII